MKKLISILTLICLTVSLFATFGVTVSAAESYWYDSFTQEGSGTVVKKDGMVTMTSGATTADADLAHLTRRNWTDQVKPQMDVEWDAQLIKHNGAQLVIFYTGQCRFYMHINVDNIWCRGYSASAQYESLTIPYDIGYDMHHYQLITDGYYGDLYIDGYYAGTVSGEVSTHVPGTLEMLARTQNTGPASWKFGNLKFNKWTGRKISTGSEDGTPTSSTFLEKNWEYMRLPNEDTFYDFNSMDDYPNWVRRDTWDIEDGVASSWNTQDLKMLSFYGPFAVEAGQDFTYTTRFRMDKFGEQQGIIPSWPNGSFRGYIYREYVEFETPYGIKRSNEIYLEEGRWYEYTVKVTDGGTKNQLFIDGVPVTGVEPALDNNDHPYNGTTYYFTYPNGSMYSGLSIDWTKVELVHNDLEFAVPKMDAEYLEGEKIEIEVDVAEGKEAEIPAVDYKVNGITVATGKAPDYKAEISGLKAGLYELTAVCGDKQVSNARTFEVRRSVLAEIQTSQDDNGNLFANLEFFDKMPQVAKVEYRLDGKVVATSTQAPYFEMSLSSLAPMLHTLEVICYDKAGIVLYESSKQFTTKAANTQASENFSNEIRYIVSGTSGRADVNVSNGRHQLKMTHTPDGVTYLTEDGEMTYKKGLGHFIIVTDGPFAEVYRNGQMVFTFVMPMTKEIAKSFVDNGLTIEYEKVLLPKEKATYFAMNNITAEKSVYNLGDLPKNHVMDVILDVNDEGRIVLNDEYYRTDLQIEDGEVYVWTTKVEMMEPFRKYAGKLSDWANADGKIYLRAETATGMTRLYANGKWVFSFRSVPTVGEGTLAVENKGDGFEFLCVGDNNDLYFYEDNFEGDTEYDSLTQWRSVNRQNNNSMAMSIDKSEGCMVLGASGGKYVYADVAAFGGDIELNADVKVVDGTKGFWFDFNRPTNHPYSRAGYDFENGQFEIVDVNTSGSTSVTKKADFPTGEFVNMGLKVKTMEDGSKKATLYVNGEEVLSKNDSTYWRGKFGFVMKDGTAYVDNFKYRGDIKVLADARETFIGVNVDLIDHGGDEYVLANTYAYRTTDGGKTFVQDDSVSVMSDNTVTLQNGDVLGLKSEMQYIGEDGKQYWNFIPYISHDMGKTWERHGTDKLAEEDHIGMIYSAMQNRVKQGPSGRVYAVCTTDVACEWWSQIKVFYSDDNGLTWNDSETLIDNTLLAKDSHNTPGHTFVELVPLELANGDVYLFGRTNLGYIGYIKSEDGGKTFDTSFTYDTPFLSVEVCYSIEVDPYNPEHVYAVFGYDNDNINGKGQYPRHRWFVARSTDSMKTWQMLGTVHENQGTIGAMMNTNIHITENQVLVNAFSYDDSITGSQYGRTIALQKDAQVGSNRFERLHLAQEIRAENTRTVYPFQSDRTIVVHPESGAALLHNKRMENVVSGSYLSADVAAAYVSANIVEEEDGSLTLDTLGCKTTFAKDEVTVVDGRYFVDIDAFAKAYGLYIDEEFGTKIISPYDGWSDLQRASLRFSLDFFSKEL